MASGGGDQWWWTVLRAAEGGWGTALRVAVILAVPIGGLVLLAALVGEPAVAEMLHMVSK